MPGPLHSHSDGKCDGDKRFCLPLPQFHDHASHIAVLLRRTWRHFCPCGQAARFECHIRRWTRSYVYSFVRVAGPATVTLFVPFFCYPFLIVFFAVTPLLLRFCVCGRGGGRVWMGRRTCSSLCSHCAIGNLWASSSPSSWRLLRALIREPHLHMRSRPPNNSDLQTSRRGRHGVY